MARLRDLGSDEFEIAATGDYPVAARDRWLILLDSGQPFCSLSPGSVLDAATPPPPIIVASANLDLRAALASPAFAQARDVSAVVLVEEQRVVGVWGGPRLETIVSRGVVPSSRWVPIAGRDRRHPVDRPVLHLPRATGDLCDRRLLPQ